jgi:hypothetical protein
MSVSIGPYSCRLQFSMLNLDDDRGLKTLELGEAHVRNNMLGIVPEEKPKPELEDKETTRPIDRTQHVEDIVQSFQFVLYVPVKVLPLTVSAKVNLPVLTNLISRTTVSLNVIVPDIPVILFMSLYSTTKLY